MISFHFFPICDIIFRYFYKPILFICILKCPISHFLFFKTNASIPVHQFPMFFFFVISFIFRMRVPFTCTLPVVLSTFPQWTFRITDVTEFKYYVGPVVHKIYLSAILDLYDRRIVSFVVRDSNNNALVFDTFDEAIEKNPNAHPLCHSDRGVSIYKPIIS